MLQGDCKLDLLNKEGVVAMAEGLKDHPGELEEEDSAKDSNDESYSEGRHEKVVVEEANVLISEDPEVIHLDGEEVVDVLHQGNLGARTDRIVQKVVTAQLTFNLDAILA